MELRSGHIINGPAQQIATTSTLSSANMDFMTPPTFDGSLRSDPVTWIFKFELYVQLKGLSEEARRACFILCMNDVAAVWMKSTKDAATKSWDDLKAEFRARFGNNAADKSDRMQAVWTAKQSKSEPVRNYYDRMISMAADLDMSEQLLISAIQAGLNPAIKQFVARKQPKSLKELLDSATLAESTDYSTFDTALPDSIASTLQRLEKKLDDTHLASITIDQNNYGRHQERHRSPNNHTTHSSADRAGASFTHSPSPGLRQPYRSSNLPRNLSPSSSRTYYRKTKENFPSTPALQTSHGAGQNVVRNY